MHAGELRNISGLCSNNQIIDCSSLKRFCQLRKEAFLNGQVVSKEIDVAAALH